MTGATLAWPVPIRGSFLGLSRVDSLTHPAEIEIFGRKVRKAYGWAPTSRRVEALIAGRRYLVPLNYLDILEVELDGTSTGFLAVAKLPDLTPRDDAGWRKWGSTRGFSAWASILVKVPYRSIESDFPITYQILGRGREGSKVVGERAGLRVVEPTAPDPHVGRPFYRLEPADPIGERRYIVCETKPPGRDPKRFSAGCTQFFVVDGLVVRATYAAQYADDWRSTETRVADLIRSFQQQSPEEDKANADHDR